MKGLSERVEDERVLQEMMKEIMTEQEQEAAINAAPVKLKTGKYTVGDNGVQYQQCGGGRRVIRKKIEGN